MSVPTEDNYIDWTLQGIRDYFRRTDYRVRTYSIGQVRERQCPIDRILAVGNKLVGLQFKRPESDGPPWRYPTTPHQHADIARARWIFYVLPDFSDTRLQEVALFHCRFASAVDQPALLHELEELRGLTQKRRDLVEKAVTGALTPDEADQALNEAEGMEPHLKAKRAGIVARLPDPFRPYYRWGAFADALLECREGIELRDERAADTLFHSMLDAPRDLYLALNRRAEEAYLIRRGQAVGMERQPA